MRPDDEDEFTELLGRRPGTITSQTVRGLATRPSWRLDGAGRWAGDWAGWGVLAVAVATATILTTINVMLGPTAKPPVAAPATLVKPAAPVPAPPFAFTFSGYQVDDYRVLPPDEVSLVDQGAVVVREGATGEPRQYVGTLTVYQPGMFDPQAFQTVAPLVVSGRDAYQASDPGPVTLWTGLAAPTGFVVVPAAGASPMATDLGVLAWQYADNAWAVLANEPFAEPIPLVDQVRIAVGFAGAVSPLTMAKVPFQAGYPASRVHAAVDQRPAPRRRASRHRDLRLWITDSDRRTGPARSAGRDQHPVGRRPAAGRGRADQPLQPWTSLVRHQPAWWRVLRRGGASVEVLVGCRIAPDL